MGEDAFGGGEDKEKSMEGPVTGLNLHRHKERGPPISVCVNLMFYYLNLLVVFA